MSVLESIYAIIEAVSDWFGDSAIVTAFESLIKAIITFYVSE